MPSRLCNEHPAAEGADDAFYRDGVVVADKELELAVRNGGQDAGIRALMCRFPDPDVEFFRVAGDDSFA